MFKTFLIAIDGSLSTSSYIETKDWQKRFDELQEAIDKHARQHKFTVKAQQPLYIHHIIAGYCVQFEKEN